MKIEWKQLEDQSYEGFDEHGNRYRQPCNKETATVFLTDGRSGQGWTAEEAFKRANERPIAFKIGGVYNAVCTPPNGNEPVKYEGFVFKGEKHENEDVTLQEFIDGYGKSVFIDPGTIGSTWKFYYMRQAHCIFHVWSGLDAFEVKVGEKTVFLPYISVIATDPEQAREMAAALINQKLEDQDTNPDYKNYVDVAEFKDVHSIS